MTEYVQDAALDSLVKKIISGNDPALNAIRDQELKIVAVMKVRTNADGEHEQNSGPPAKIMKVNDLWKLFTDAHYLLVVDYYFFNHASCVEAMLFNALCEIDVKTKDGEVKLATKKPEIQVFAATLQKYGAFDETLLGMKEWMNEAKSKAAKSFADSIASGNIDSEQQQEADDSDERPRVQSGVPDEENLDRVPSRARSHNRR